MAQLDHFFMTGVAIETQENWMLSDSGNASADTMHWEGDHNLGEVMRRTRRHTYIHCRTWDTSDRTRIGWRCSFSSGDDRAVVAGCRCGDIGHGTGV